MNKIIEIYRANEVKKLEHAKDEAIIAIKCENETYAAMRAAKKAIKNADEVVSLRGFTFDKEVNDRIDAVRVELATKIAELDTKLHEVYMMLDLAPTSKDKMAVSKTYGIVDSNSKIVR